MSGQENGEGATGKGSKPVAPSTGRSGDQPDKPKRTSSNGSGRIHSLLRPLIVSGPNDQSEYRLTCPFNRHSRKDGTLTLSLSKRVYYCHACGSKGSIGSMIDFLSDSGPTPSRSDPVRKAKQRTTAVSSRPLPTESQIRRWQELLVECRAYGYLKSRGFTLETIERWEIGWNPQTFEYMLPVRDRSGKLTNIRRYHPNRNPKMKNWRGHGSASLYPSELLGESELVLCEGEWDCLLLNQHGIPAITGTGGAPTWKDDWAKLLRDKVGPVIYDSDESGRKGRDKALAALPGSWAVDLDPDRRDGYDITDWFRDGRSAEDLRELIEQSRAKPEDDPIMEEDDPVLEDEDEFEPDPDDQRDMLLDGHAATQFGNAERFVTRHGDDVLYLPSKGEGSWYIWDGKRWGHDSKSDSRVEGLAWETIMSMYRTAASHIKDDEAVALRSWAKASETEFHRRTIVKLARTTGRILVSIDDLDADQWLATCLNGTIDLRTGDLHPHRREDRISRLMPVKYDPTVESSAWERFLEQILPDPELRAFVKRLAGYSLTGSVREEIFTLLLGKGENGKTKLIEALRYVFGDYAQSAPASTFLVKQFGGGIPSDVARMTGARFVTAVELEKEGKLAEALVKQLTGGDKITARQMYKDWFEFYPTQKFWLATNYLPQIQSDERAIWRRILPIPFDVNVASLPGGLNKNLIDDLHADAEYILRWLVEGCLEWQKVGLGVPERVRQFSEEYRQGQNAVGKFWNVHCIVEPDHWEPTATLYAAYCSWAEERKYSIPTDKDFGSTLKRAAEGKIMSRKRNGVRGWLGLRLLEYAIES